MNATRALRRLPLVLAAAVLGLGGCVGQSEWDALYETNRSLTNANTQLQQERDEARTALDLQRAQLARAEGALNGLRDENGRLRTDLDAANQQLLAFGQRLQGIQLAALDPETDAMLKELAAKYPNLIAYDPEMGRLRFAADLTFDSGRAIVRENAKASLAALADILKSSAASGYEVHIVGHTDSQRISAGTAREHPTNVHLSCHRAIAVRAELAGYGIEPTKLMSAGWGEFRPLVPNSPSGNTPENRRVEIFLTRARGGSPAQAAAAAPEPTPAQPMDVTK